MRIPAPRSMAIIGARSRARLYEDNVLDETCASIAVMTDDGSAGMQGLVTDPMAEMVKRFSPRVIYACGPMPMLRAVAAVASELGVPSQIAVEEFMACGIGVCWTCVLPVRVNGSLKNQRSCTEGPVFGAKPDEVRGTFGFDPYPYGVEANRNAIELFLGDIANNQHLTDRELRIEELFPAHLLAR